MAVKEFLRSVREQDSLLRAYEQELEDLRRRAYNISSPKFGDKIQSNHLATLVNQLIPCGIHLFDL